MPSTTETSTKMNSTLIAYLETEKVAAAARMRQCETFLASTVPLTDDEDDSSVRDCLRSIASNAEEDFGTTLHLLTLLKRRTEGSTKRSDNPGNRSLNCPLTPPNEVVATEYVSQPSSMGADVDPSAIDPLFPGSDDNKQREVPEENDESADVVPNLVTQKTGRFTHTTTRAVTADDDVGMGGNFARSLPVSVPPPPGMDRLSDSKRIGEASEKKKVDLPGAEQLLASEDIPAANDILTSMQTIARSLHINTNTLGDLPHSIHRAMD